MTKYSYGMKCTKCGKEFIYKSEHAMLEVGLYNKIVVTAVCPTCKKKLKEHNHEPCEICQKKVEESKSSMSIGERLYCLEQDVEEYIQHNGLEADKELDWILKQINDIKEIIQKEIINNDSTL